MKTYQPGCATYLVCQYFTSVTIRAASKSGIKDWALWERAQADSLVIITQDADFTERMLMQEPPWVVHVRTGNMKIADFRALLDAVWPQVWSLLADHKLVSIYRDHLEAVRTG